VSRISCRCARSCTGCRGQAEQLSAVTSMPRRSSASRKSSRAPRSLSSSDRFMCGAGDCPPAAISTASSPSSCAKSSAPSNERSETESV
jgi:hypothetical protein